MRTEVRAPLASGCAWLRSISPARCEPRAEVVERIDAGAGQSEQLVGRTIYSAGFTWPGVMFWDDIRTVDYLLTRPEVDQNINACEVFPVLLVILIRIVISD